jgi:hypothetical protein
MQEFFSQYLRAALILIAIAVALTIFVFRRRLFERGPRKGTPINPDEIRKHNPPDEWSRRH